MFGRLIEFNAGQEQRNDLWAISWVSPFRTVWTHIITILILLGGDNSFISLTICM